MAQVLQSSPSSHFPSPSSSSSSACSLNNDATDPHSPAHIAAQEEEEEVLRGKESKDKEREVDPLNLLAALLAAFRKSLAGCSISGGEELRAMEIGLPTNVRHVAHVTFDRFNGFLGLPVEFEPEVPRRAPSASANVFGVSTESMQLCYDSRGNSVPTILLMMQRHLYARGGLQAEGIFRINGDNGQEEFVREQLNRGVIPDGVDVHCLAGLMKAWFRELPRGVLDSLSPEDVMQSQTEEECARLMSLLPAPEAALLDWAINLMADVVQMEHLNKMNARNIAMVFAPNMTQMSDPLTALMYAVQVMNFLKMLIVKVLRERQEESSAKYLPPTPPDPSDHNDDSSATKLCLEEAGGETNRDNDPFSTEEPAMGSSDEALTSVEKIVPPRGGNHPTMRDCPCEIVSQVNVSSNGSKCKWKTSRSRGLSAEKKGLKKGGKGDLVGAEKSKGSSLAGQINSRMELFDAWS